MYMADIDGTRKILSNVAKDMSDEQIGDIASEVEFLTESWLDQYERTIFDGETLAEKFPQTRIIKADEIPLKRKHV